MAAEKKDSKKVRKTAEADEVKAVVKKTADREAKTVEKKTALGEKKAGTSKSRFTKSQIIGACASIFGVLMLIGVILGAGAVDNYNIVQDIAVNDEVMRASNSELTNYMNEELKNGGYDDTQFGVMRIVKTASIGMEKFELSRASATDTLSMYALRKLTEDDILQMRYQLKIDSSTVTEQRAFGFLVGRTLLRMYGDVPDKDNFAEDLKLAEAAEDDIDSTFVVQDSIVRTRSKDGVITIFITAKQYSAQEKEMCGIVESGSTSGATSDSSSASESSSSSGSSGAGSGSSSSSSGAGSSSATSGSSSGSSSSSSSSSNAGSSSSSSVTASQSNAARKAQSYLRSMAFSREGLIGQLEYEGFSTTDATYGVDNVGADWYAQAVKKAQSYLRSSSFSRSGLIGQLEYEKFTTAEAEYGADNACADWYEQAVKKAKSYLRSSSFSHDRLVSQLLYEGFSEAEAEYGVSQNGL